MTNHPNRSNVVGGTHFQARAVTYTEGNRWNPPSGPTWFLRIIELATMRQLRKGDDGLPHVGYSSRDEALTVARAHVAMLDDAREVMLKHRRAGHIRPPATR